MQTDTTGVLSCIASAGTIECAQQGSIHVAGLPCAIAGRFVLNSKPAAGLSDARDPPGFAMFESDPRVNMDFARQHVNANLDGTLKTAAVAFGSLLSAWFLGWA